MGALDFVSIPNDPKLVGKAFASRQPTASDDASSGFFLGSFWWDTGTETLFWCADPTVGNAVWFAFETELL